MSQPPTDPEPVPAAAAPSPAPRTYADRLRWLLSPEGAGLLVVIGSLGFVYWPTLVDLVGVWHREPDYSHGFLVLPIVGLILGRLWPSDPANGPRVFWPGLLLVVLGLGLRAFLQARGNSWSMNATLLLVVAGLALSGLGWRTLRATWPAFAFLIFLLPLPTAVNDSLSQPLRSLATTASTQVLRATGLWVMPEGNVIVVGGEPLEVAEACNGLSMLMSLAATVAAAAALIPMAPFKRIILLFSIVPVALFSNVIRISATAWCYHQFGAKVGGAWAHDLAGYLMMPLAMALVGLELWVLSWLVVETTEAVAAGFRFEPGLSSASRPGLGGAAR